MNLKQNYLFLLLTILAFLQSTIVLPNLVLVSLFTLVFHLNLRWVIYLAFFSGILLDFLEGTPLGSQAVILLFLSLVWFFVRNQFFATAAQAWSHWLPQLVLAVIAGSQFYQFLINLVNFNQLTLTIVWSKISAEIILAILAFVPFSYLCQRWIKQQLELRF